MASTFSSCLMLLLAVSLLSANVAASNSRPPRNNDISNMADALKYLQDLDTYYGDRARVRFGKRVPLMQILRTHLIDNPETLPLRPMELSPAEEPF